MVPQSVVAEIRRLLRETTLSQRKIGALTGVARGTVGAIAAGRRPDYQAVRSQEENDWEEPAGPPVRCGGCGGLVYMPCLLCAARKAARKGRRLAKRHRDELLQDPLALDLRPEHQARYEEVCAWHALEGDSPIFAGAKIGTVPRAKIATVPTLQ